MSTEIKDPKKEGLIKELFKLGAHFGYSRRSSHPSTRPYVFGFKNRTAIIDLERTADLLEEAQAFVKSLGQERKQILFVGTKNEGKEAIEKAAKEIDMPYVSERWIGGTFTNNKQIKKRVERLLELKDKEEKGELSVYTKKERGVIAKEKQDLERYFAGIVKMTKIPAAMIVVDNKREEIAVDEAIKLKVPVVSLSSSDCNLGDVSYPVVANDSSRETISYFLNQLVAAYKEGLMTVKEEVKAEGPKE